MREPLATLPGMAQLTFGGIAMSKRAAIFVALVVLMVAVLLAGVGTSQSGPNGKVVSRLQKKDAGGYVHTVTVRKFAGRFNTELSDEGSGSRILRVSSYEFYEGSYPITNAAISWPELQKFSVSFDNGVTVDCSWSRTNCIWTAH
jgi:hypothetical protein